MSGGWLRVVAGDGTGDRPLADSVAPVTPAWSLLRIPCPRARLAVGPKMNLVAYGDRRTGTPCDDVDAGGALWHTDRYAAPISELQWSTDRKRLLVRAGSFVDFLDARGRALNRVTWPTLGVSMSPDSKRTAFIRRTRQGRSEVMVTGRYGEGQPRPVLTRAGRLTDPTWSPDGKWLLVARHDADQWLFIRPSRPVRVDAVANISRQFAPAPAASRLTRGSGAGFAGRFGPADRSPWASPRGGAGSPARPRRGREP